LNETQNKTTELEWFSIGCTGRSAPGTVPRRNQGDNSAFDLNVQVESTTGDAGITGKSKTKHPRVPRAPRGLLFLNTQVKNALNESPETLHSFAIRFTSARRQARRFFPRRAPAHTVLTRPGVIFRSANRANRLICTDGRTSFSWSGLSRNSDSGSSTRQTSPTSF
jgi:hypothetical protein